MDASPVREHLQALSRAGIGWKRASELSGISTGAISKLCSPLQALPFRFQTGATRTGTGPAIMLAGP